jgi:hypothetical protein
VRAWREVERLRSWIALLDRFDEHRQRPVDQRIVGAAGASGTADAPRRAR